MQHEKSLPDPCLGYFADVFRLKKPFHPFVTLFILVAT